MMLGITPILVSELSMQLLVASKCINVDSNAPKARTVLNGAQKLLGILTTILGALVYVLESVAAGILGTGNAVLVMLQLLFSGIVVIYPDDILKNGYGLLSSISLFTATNI
uniref:Pco109407 n=1 Tax=Arundo donax TaxID=35708 RepID=A0A0A9FX64_ARUDO